MTETERTRKIRDVNAMIRALVEQETLEYPFWLGGIVTRCFVSDFGHVYFDLKDGDTSISCMLREEVRGTLDFTLTNNMDVSVFGAVRVYEKQARVQIEVEQIRLINGVKSDLDNPVLMQLQAQGLWPKTKKSLPATIRKIGLITSKHSEALHDFESTYRDEGGTASVKLIDVRLQSAPDIGAAINRFNREQQVDVIAVVRGGGRTAELATFNDLVIAKAICSSNIPVITGIGHQRDDTLADQVADFSAITPTAAASHLARIKASTSPITPSVRQPSSRLVLVFGSMTLLVLVGLLLFIFLR